MRFGKSLFVPAILAGLAMFSSVETKAGLINLDSFAPSGSGGTVFSYSITIPSGDSIQNGDFFRIYDFNGYIAGSISAGANAGWVASVALSNPTPPPDVIINHGDDPAIFNLIFTYTGTAPILASTLSGFTARSTSATISTDVKNAVANYTTVGAGAAAGGQDPYRTDVFVPAAVPEPASLISAGLGALLIGAGYGLRNRRKMSV